MSTTVTLHCKPFVKKWIEKQYGSPVQFPRKSNIKHTVSICLGKTFHPSTYYNKQTFTTHIEIKVSQHDVTQHGSFISPNLQHFMHRHLENMVNMDIYMHVRSYIENGRSLSEAYKAYSLLYAFDDAELSITAIENRYERMLKLFKNIFSKTALNKKPCTQPA